MYTQCPECHARFRVGASELSAAAGTVRCGRCGSGFNALAWLSDTLPPSLPYVADDAAPDGPAALDTASDGVAGVGFHFTPEDIESVFVESGGWPGRAGPGRPGVEAAGPSQVVVGENEPFEDITLEGERIRIESILGIEDEMYETVEEPEPVDDYEPSDEREPIEEREPVVEYEFADEEDEQTSEFEILRDVPDSAYPEFEDEAVDAIESDLVGPVPTHRPAAATAAHTAAVPRPAPANTTEDGFETEAARSAALEALLDPRLEPESVPLPALARRNALEAERSLSAALARKAPRKRRGRASLLWAIGCLVVAVALLAQVTHQFRQDLARDPRIGPLLSEIYARLGIPLSPNWDLGGFELRQWGNGGSEVSGRLAVRASLTNRAAFAQPHPVLRLELDDRYGDSIAVRDFEPAEYLKNPSEASRLLAPGASAEAELLIADPGQDAVGYQLDVCLHESSSVLRCARGTG